MTLGSQGLVLFKVQYHGTGTSLNISMEVECINTHQKSRELDISVWIMEGSTVLK